jgi:hypothetical protein
MIMPSMGVPVLALEGVGASFSLISPGAGRSGESSTCEGAWWVME